MHTPLVVNTPSVEMHYSRGLNTPADTESALLGVENTPSHEERVIVGILNTLLEAERGLLEEREHSP